MESYLICNIRKCRKQLRTGGAWVTACSHILCEEDGEKLLANSKTCPVCGHSLPNKMEIVHVNINPTELYKTMALIGHRPDVILDICSRAVAFWMFQTNEEARYKEHIVGRQREKLTKMETAFAKMATSFKVESKSMQEEVRKLKDDLSRSKQQVEELNVVLREKSREMQKVQASRNLGKLSGGFSASPVDFTFPVPGEGDTRQNDKPRPASSEFVIPFGNFSPKTSSRRESNSSGRKRAYPGSLQCSPFQVPNLFRFTPTDRAEKDEGISRQLFR